jgi:hypothetical protein
MQLPAVRAEIEHMRRQIHRQRREIRDLQRAGIPTVSAEELLVRMLTKLDDLCVERDRLAGAQKISGHKQSHQWTDRAALPVSWWLNDRVRCRGQKAINKVRFRDWFRLVPRNHGGSHLLRGATFVVIDDGVAAGEGQFRF